MLKSKLFFVAALLLGGCLTMNATNVSCYYQAEIHAVGHGKIYADGEQCMADSTFLKGKDAYQTQVSVLCETMALAANDTTAERSLYIFTLPDADEYIPVGVKFDSLEAELSDIEVDTCSWETEDDVKYATQRVTTEDLIYSVDTAYGVVYVIFKIKPEIIQAAIDSVDNYLSSKTGAISEELRLAIEESKKNIRENDDDLDAMKAALTATIKKIDELFPSALPNIRSKEYNATKRIINGRLFIEVNGIMYDAFGSPVL